MLTTPEYLGIIKLILAVLIGAVIGFTRRRKPAGIRTFSLICLGCTLFTLIATEINYPGTDMTRIIAQIISGIGFLGLGVIWREKINKPAGLTTAAAVWTTAGIGILIGLEMWLYAAVGSALIIVVLYSKEQKVIRKLEGGNK